MSEGDKGLGRSVADSFSSPTLVLQLPMLLRAHNLLHWDSHTKFPLSMIGGSR
jgi:hypothetical protein